MNLEAIAPIMEEIVKESLSDKVYLYGRFQKSFRIRDLKTGKFLPKNEKNIKSTAFVVARSIGRFGYQNKPKNFVEISYDKILKDKRIIDLMEDALYDDVLNALEGL